MNTEQIRSEFAGRKAEVDDYLSLLKALEVTTSPLSTGSDKLLDVQQLKILRAHMFLHLYNLVEASMVWCLTAVSAAPMRRKSWKADHLSERMLEEIISQAMGTASNLDTIRSRAQDLAKKIMTKSPVREYKFDPVKSSGNWNLDRIYKVSNKIGIKLTLSPQVNESMHRAGYIDIIWRKRNDLAHGDISFRDAGEDVTISELEEYTLWTVKYLQEVMECYCSFVDNHEFLQVRYRPTVVIRSR